MPDEIKKPTCGIVMPISGIDGCSESHWIDTLQIITEAIVDAGFEGNLVSNADDVGIIQKRIIQNLYENPIVVCDVSGKNPNVMFELGVRLAFDKPTIIIKDDKTTYSFDTAPIEHLEYPRDLRFTKIVEFKNKLSEKIKATHGRATTDSNYTTFLKHFGEFKVAKIDQKEVSGQEFILDELKTIRASMRRLERENRGRSRDDQKRYKESFWDDFGNDSGDERVVDHCLGELAASEVSPIFSRICELAGVESVEIAERGLNHNHLLVRIGDGVDKQFVRRKLIEMLGSNSLRHASK